MGSGLPTIGSLLHQKKLQCTFSWQNLVTLRKVPKVVLHILKLRLNMLNVDSDFKSIGFLGKILHIHSLETYSPHTETGNRFLTVEFLNMKERIFLLPQRKILLLSLP